MPTEIFGPKASRAVARQRFENLLQTRIQRQPDDRRILHGRDGLVGGMRRENWHRLAQARHRRGLGLNRIFLGRLALFDHAIEHAIARRARGIGITIEPSGFRRLRQRHQQRRFRQRQSLRLLAEIGDRRGANALEIAAIRRQRQIQIENLIFCQLPLDFERANHLAQLGVNRPLPPRLQQPGQLHGDGGAAGDDVATADQLKRGAAQGERIDAGMDAEAPVFIGQQQLEIAGIDAGPGVDRQPPAAVGHGVSAQQLAVAVDDRGGDPACLRQRQWPQRDHPHREGSGQDQAGCGRRCCCQLDPSPAARCRRYRRRCAHFAGSTSTDPVPLRP